MKENLTKNERELLKLAKFFKKKAVALMEAGKLNENAQQTAAACEKLESSLFAHASYREAVRQKRENLKNIIQDNALCPKCNTNSQLKLVGTVQHEKGWRSSKYKCRRCNVEFVMNKPNNPWDMIPFIESVITELESQENIPDFQKLQNEALIAQMQESLGKLRPVIENSDQEYNDMEEKELEMAKMVHEFKNYLQIEKIRMNTWDSSMV